jgi:hypothetical protein
MKIQAEYMFKVPMDKAIEILVHKSIGNVDYFMETMPDLTYAKLLERRDDPDGKIHIRMEMCAFGQIPKAAQHILKPDMLVWQEISTWDPAKRTYTYDIKTKHLTKLFTFKGIWGYREAGPDKTVQFCHGEVNIALPLIGGLIEKAIWPALKKNWDENYKIMTKKYNM